MEEKSSLGKLLGKVFEGFIEYREIDKKRKEIGRKVKLGVGGHFLLMVGVLFLLIGVVTFLSRYLPAYISWLIVGFFLLLFGINLILVGR